LGIEGHRAPNLKVEDWRFSGKFSMRKNQGTLVISKIKPETIS